MTPSDKMEGKKDEFELREERREQREIERHNLDIERAKLDLDLTKSREQREIESHEQSMKAQSTFIALVGEIAADVSSAAISFSTLCKGLTELAALQYQKQAPKTKKVKES